MSKTAKKKIAKKPPYSAKNEIARLWTQSKMQRETNKIHRERLEKQMSALHDRLTALESRSAPAEEWVPKVGDWLVRSEKVIDWESYGVHQVVGGSDIPTCAFMDNGQYWDLGAGFCRPATEAEVASHKAKEEQRAKEAEWAKVSELAYVDQCICTPEERLELVDMAIAGNVPMIHRREQFAEHAMIGLYWFSDSGGLSAMSNTDDEPLPFAEFKRRLQGTIAKRAEDERAKKLSALKWSTRVQTPKGEGLFLSMDDPKEEAWVAVKDEGDCSWFELDLITIID